MVETFFKTKKTPTLAAGVVCLQLKMKFNNSTYFLRNL